MFSRHHFVLAAVFGLTVFSAGALQANVEGAAPQQAGAPGEASCAQCHTNTSGGFGSVQAIFQNGPYYKPGVTQNVTIIVTDSQSSVWGFEVTARQASNTANQAGTFTPGSDNFTQVVCTDSAAKHQSVGNPCPSSQPLSYITQTTYGAQAGVRNYAQFTFAWVPPSLDVGPINFYVSSVAGANTTSAPSGDFVYNKVYTIPSAVTNQPSIAQSAVVNAASYQGTISPGSWVTIQGSNLASTTASVVAGQIVAGVLPTTLNGVSVLIDNKPAFMQFISPGQLNVLAPADLAKGPVYAQVTNNGLVSNPILVNLQTIAPGLFLWPGSHAVATRTDFSYVGPAGLFTGITTVPAAPGDTVILWATGLGPSTPAVAPGRVTPSDRIYGAAAPVVTIGGVPANVVGTALSPGSAGLYQIALQVPAVGDGEQEVILQSGGLSSPGGVFLTVKK